MASIGEYDLKKIGSDLKRIIDESSERGLRHTDIWASELYCALIDQIGTDTDFNSSELIENKREDIKANEREYAYYRRAKSYFDNQEYDRAAYFVQHSTSPVARFLHYYSTYCSGEKKRLDDIAEASSPNDRSKNSVLKSLRLQLQKAHISGSLDGYCLYLYGVVLKKLQLEKYALEILCEAVQKEPLFWGSWLELATLISDREMLNDLTLPDCWIKDFFLAHTYLEIQMNESALEIYSSLMEAGFSKSTYVMAQIAIAHHNMRNLEEAIVGFQDILKVDPYRLDNLDIYSNLLYVQEMRVELSNLAHNTCDIDKYRVETCCVIGNFYSLRTQHEKAVLYFQRALKLNPSYLSAWTLMGHEYMEMKNTSFAIQAYRQAIEVNRRDYRAWYGLGQTYEILKMPYYCLYYYKQAQYLRPYDSRMMVALGEAYEKLDKLKEAKKCFWKAHAVGDIEGMALIKLAKMYEKLNEEKQAAAAYTNYIRDAEARNATDRDELCHAYLYLAKYYYEHLKLEEAHENAQKCLDYPETKEDAKALLRQITARRIHAEEIKPNSGVYRFPNTTPSPVHISPMNLTFTP
ncbi:cell division cycle protein 23 homolog [Parasteatoda tepidariorum]|uniref:Cyclosome subunit 8 n=1 Tax=Parasteatoda tepidariorum TaxID=114398 RepID=A0A2L2Y7Y8_PARTP|nr:cell division cycle protein 23 homolog [Parasteatoda tepidariorum]XP_042901182.1 cell division cycle protein 23 homolog [Parasteatoda tepidariorum]XP_042901183.1 cell division cycle protein 23 homolog [Parasteatoda tepidariorum]XP_042901185.1 cell division cycle protein 23 homolog [Parasteatoda tepidariorum]